MNLLKDQKGIQGIAMGMMDGIIAMLGTTLAVSVVSDNFIFVFTAGLSVGAANGFATAAGFYVSEEIESEHVLARHTKKDILKSALLCFITSMMTVFLALVPYLFLELKTARTISLVVGLLILFNFGIYHASISKENRLKEGLKFSGIGLVVSIICFYIGKFINLFNQ